jgi:tetratricopeptide (TPR) repeat protein
VNNPGSSSSSVGGMGYSSSLTGGFLSKVDLDASILYFTNELNLDPNNSEALLRRGDLYLQRGDFDKAMNDFKGGLQYA